MNKSQCIRLSCLLLLVVMTTSITAQNKTINDLATFRIKNSGTLMDADMDVDGYYFFYEVDKLKKGQREFAIKLLDKDLNNLATKSYVDHKNVTLTESKFNNQALMFAMTNHKEDYYRLVLFDRSGNEMDKIEVPATRKEIAQQLKLKAQGFSDLVFSIDGKGFLFNTIRNNKKMGFSLKYVPTDGGQPWNYASPEDSKEIQIINPIKANKDVVVALHTSKKSMLSSTLNLKVVVLDITNGKVLFERDFDKKEDPRMITNAFITEDKNVVLLGEYYEEGDNIYRAKSQGLFAETLDFSGNRLSDSKVSWSDKLGSMLADNSDKKSQGYIYFHDVVRTQKGTYYAIGERYKRKASGSAIAAMALGGGNGAVTQLTITDALLFEFDKDFALSDVKIFEKGKSRVPEITSFASPQVNAHIINMMGGFDYQFTQIDTKRDRFYATFIDYERLKGEKNKHAFKSIMYQDGKFAQDKIYLQKSKGKIISRVMPGKLGHVVLLEYDKKAKTLDIHLEKMNFDTGMSK